MGDRARRGDTDVAVRRLGPLAKKFRHALRGIARRLAALDVEQVAVDEHHHVARVDRPEADRTPRGWGCGRLTSTWCHGLPSCPGDSLAGRDAAQGTAKERQPDDPSKILGALNGPPCRCSTIRFAPIGEMREAPEIPTDAAYLLRLESDSPRIISEPCAALERRRRGLGRPGQQSLRGTIHEFAPPRSVGVEYPREGL